MGDVKQELSLVEKFIAIIFPGCFEGLKPLTCRQQKLVLNLLSKDVFSCFDTEQRETIKLRYGLADGICHERKDIAEILEITKARVRNIENAVLKRLKWEEDFKLHGLILSAGLTELADKINSMLTHC